MKSSRTRSRRKLKHLYQRKQIYWTLTIGTMYQANHTSTCQSIQSNKVLTLMLLHHRHFRMATLLMARQSSSNNLPCMQFNHTVGLILILMVCRRSNNNNTYLINHRTLQLLSLQQLRRSHTQEYSHNNHISSSGSPLSNSSFINKDIHTSHKQTIRNKHSQILTSRHISNNWILGQLPNRQYRCNRLNTRLTKLIFICVWLVPIYLSIKCFIPC
jgi:hypothetical protein